MAIVTSRGALAVPRPYLVGRRIRSRPRPENALCCAIVMRNGEKAAYRPETRDVLLEEKDQIIAELEEQVALLRRELAEKDAILSGKGAHESPAASEGAFQTAKRGDGQAKDAKPALPNGYRVVAVASDAWVLITPRGLRVAIYRGELDLCKAALDATKHHHSER